MKKRTFVKRERGQVIFLVAGLLAVFGGMTAVAIDLGSYMADRRDLQNAVDAIALAASQDLPSGSAAQTAANQWATNNGIDHSSLSVTIVPQNLPSEPNPKVIVEAERDHGFFFARLVGIESAEVSASASAIRTSPGGGDGVVPLSITEDSLEGVTYGEAAILKYDALDLENGNSLPIMIDGPGAGSCNGQNNHYCDSLINGSENVLCADGADDTYCEGPTTAQTQPGLVVGPTSTALNARMDNTDIQCDEFDEVFEDDPTSSDPSEYRIVQECNPFFAAGYDSRRILVVPVIDSLCNGSCTVTVVEFALFFLDGFAAPNSCQGVVCEVTGRFVRVNQNVGLLAGTFDEEAENQFVRLVN